MLPLSKCRQLLNDHESTDEEITLMQQQLRALANLLFDCVDEFAVSREDAN